jgi:hypothetical protein
MLRYFKYIAFVFPLLIKAQEVCSNQVNFTSAKYDLTHNAQQMLDKDLATLKNIPKAYKIIIYGHTDNVGNLNYNQQLSSNRAKSVRSYFLKKGFLEKDIRFESFAYEQPISENESDEGKAKNRRVNYKIIAKTPDLGSLIKGTNSNATYKMNAEKMDTFYYSSGTKLVIPANAFETAGGKPVTGEVTVNYIEYRDPVDFIKSGIPMSFMKDKELALFNSGGMFRIEARQNSEQLKLRADKKIKIDFKAAQELPKMEFFGFDTTHHQWVPNTQASFPASSITEASNSQWWIGSDLSLKKSLLSIRKNINGKDSCLLSSCIGNEMAARRGLELSQSPWPVNIYRPAVYFKEYKTPNYHQAEYQLKVLRQNKYQVEFVVIPKDSNSIYKEFMDYKWIYTTNKQYPFKKEWETISWLRIKINYEFENNFMLTLYNNTEDFSLSVNASLDRSFQSSSDLYQFHQENKNANLERYLLQKGRNDDFDLGLIKKIKEEDSTSIHEFEKRCTDSLYCFYRYSKQWMDQTNGEADLGFTQWLDYFNGNRSLMAARYAKLKPAAVDKECLAAEKKRQDEELKKQLNRKRADSSYAVNHAAQQQTVNDQFKELSITNMGIWNCDQVERLKEPMFVKTKYKDDKGNLVEPIVIYVIDKAVNGALMYNGYMGYSPYYFPVSSKSDNTVIAFDVDNKAYVCNAKRFKEQLKDDKDSAIILDKLSKTDDLRSQITSR